MSYRSLAWSVVLAGLLATGMAFAQDAAGGGNGGGRGGRGGGPGGGADWRQQMEQRQKEALGVTDDEWKVLQPKIEKVRTLAMQARAGVFMGGRGGRGGGQGGGDAAATSDAEKKAQALNTALENKDTKPEEIAAKLKELRAARKKAAEELAKAQAELRELLTPRQEAYLVLRGTLE